MKTQKAYNQEIEEGGEFSAGDTNPSSEGAGNANMAEGGDSTDEMTDGKGGSEQAEAENGETQRNGDYEKEAAEWRDKYIRLQAEFDNFRKRTLKEKMDLIQSGGADVLKSMLTVLDDIYRAVDASEKSDDIASLREGERLVMQKFVEALRQKGVTEIEAEGRDFDADLQEAVARFAAGEDKKGKVIDVVQRGYKLGDKVLRYAKVVVGE